jgi:hypothetical protein
MLLMSPLTAGRFHSQNGREIELTAEEVNDAGGHAGIGWSAVGAFETECTCLWRSIRGMTRLSGLGVLADRFLRPHTYVKECLGQLLTFASKIGN